MAVPERSKGELQDIVSENLEILSEGNLSQFQKKKASGALPTELPTIDEKDRMHQTLTEVEPLLEASGYWAWRNILRNHWEYPCHCLAQMLWYPKGGNLIFVWDVEEMFSAVSPDQAHPVSILVVRPLNEVVESQR